MGQYLQSRPSIHDNAETIRKLNDDLVKDINSLDVLQSNPLQFTLHAVPIVVMLGIASPSSSRRAERTCWNALVVAFTT